MHIGKREHQRGQFHQPPLDDLIVLRRRDPLLHSCKSLLGPNLFSLHCIHCLHNEVDLVFALVCKLLSPTNNTKQPITLVHILPSVA